ncbi:putative UDP-glucose,sterol transferase [Aspergillus chevalieri]|uniref:Glycosyltransferase family 28 N-terminal domain-containing protein n=1 Tax=Aspergillus chevalieri TaxID=182096 RepID=A0A7R7VMG6_ASPCH|nr:uncharacterized protein ACHE_31267S [Aspergillus chevalieri]BCR87280.1 hypothetical protein ACHE_31267S [Aspergillus chevalieri]
MPPNAPVPGANGLDWPDKILAQIPDRRNHAKFWEDGLNTGVRVLEDGRLDIKVRQDEPNLAGLLHHLQHHPHDLPPRRESVIPFSEKERIHPLHLNIVIHVVGSRGDVQPFIALGKELKRHGHRVRLATHLDFKDFVNENGLEFFSIGGDPGELMAFMVKNPGLLPDLRTIRSGAIARRRQEMKEIFSGCWRSCHEMGDGTGEQQIIDNPWSETVDYRSRPFVADAIIANPPSYAHISCAEKMGVPLHLMFTMPWSPTQYFPHPLAQVRARNAKRSVANFASYAIVEMMIWEGLGDLINKFRKRLLGLDPLDGSRAPSLVHRLRIPYSYLWSPSLLPKPDDWGDNIDICGFSFLSSGSDYRPPEDLELFLNEGPAPIYIGFGSIVVDDAAKLTRIVFDAVKETGHRALVAKGWGNIGSEEVDVPDNIFLIGNCPHDWLFKHVSCVIHHGGAGTTAAGLALGRPTVVIPFFGDQQFWGSIIARAGAGPEPVPWKGLTTDKLKDAINKALESSTLERANEIGKNMESENGVASAVHCFYRHLDLDNLRCSICPNRPAAWQIRHSDIRLSAFAATVLVEAGLLKPFNVELYLPQEYDTHRDPKGPLSAGAGVLYGAISAFIGNIRDIPTGLVGSTREAGQNQARDNLDAHGPQHQPELEPEAQAEPEPEPRPGPEQSDTDAPSADPDEPEDNANGEDITRKLTTTTTSAKEKRKEKRAEALSDAGYRAGQCAKHVIDWAIMLPGDITLSLSKGFHNAPKLYHDRTVKRFPKVMGIRSGFRAAGSEFTNGFYQGLTGLITQPHAGLQRSGPTGLLKGVGKGIGCVIFKPVAGVWGLAGYPLDGIHKNLRKSLSRSSTKHFIAARIAQGIEEMCASGAEERAEVIRVWHQMEDGGRV